MNNTTASSQQFALSQLRGTKLFAYLEERFRKHSLLISATSNLQLGGSGVLATYKELNGILTATHVVSPNIDTKTIFSPIIRTPDPTLVFNCQFPIHRILKIESTKGIELLSASKGRWHEDTLDICFIQLEDPVFKIVIEMSGKEAIDLFQERLRFLTCSEKFWEEQNRTNWTWAFYGAPREEASHDASMILHSKHDGLYLSGGLYKLQHILKHVLPEYENTPVDICEHELGPTQDFLPSSFGGASGGGVWLISLKTLEEINEVFFAGVFVSETKNILYSRGPISLYEVFIPYLEGILSASRKDKL